MITIEQTERLHKIVNYTYNRFISEQEALMYLLKFIDDMQNGESIDVEFETIK